MLTLLLLCCSMPVPEETTEEKMAAVVKGYETYGRVDGKIYWAPESCKGPTARPLAFSKSSDEETHGQKLYRVFAKQTWVREDAKPDKQTLRSFFRSGTPLRSYLPQMKADGKGREDSPVGQVLVKESWRPKHYKEHDKEAIENMRKIQAEHGKKAEERKSLTKDGTGLTSEWDFGNHYQLIAQKGEKYYYPESKFGLFIMMKLDPKTPDTDNGWVYATFDEASKKFTSMGKVDNCMKCHQDAKHDRVFGLPEDGLVKK